MKALLLLIGLIAIVVGVYILVEGMGWYDYTIPHVAIANLKGNHTWGYYGGGVAILGLLIAIYSRRA
jgi:uncharacterized membrane protein